MKFTLETRTMHSAPYGFAQRPPVGRQIRRARQLRQCNTRGSLAVTRALRLGLLRVHLDTALLPGLGRVQRESLC